MSPTKFDGVHWLGYGVDGRDLDLLRELQPSSLKLFEVGWGDKNLMERLYRDLPQTLFIIRDHPLSEQHGDMRADPQGTGARHAREWADKRAQGRFNFPGFDLSRTVFLGLNEPGVNGPEIAQTVAYTVAFLDGLKGHGMRGGALNLSVGWPSNHGPGTKVDWAPYEPVRQALLRGAHILFLHEYFANWQGFNMGLGWWIDRLGQCPWDVPIIVGEAGADNYVDPVWAHTVNQENQRGFRGYWGAQEYLAALTEVDRLYCRDRRIISAMAFTYDHSSPWGSFDIKPDREAYLSWVRARRAEPAQPLLSFPRYPQGVNPPPQEPPPMPPTAAPITQTARGNSLVNSLRAHAIEGVPIYDLRGSLPHHASLRFSLMDSREADNIVIHESASLRSTTAQAINSYHIGQSGGARALDPFAGIGYHYLIRYGAVYIVGDSETMRAHVAGKNDEGVGVCITGSYRSTPIYPDDLKALKWLVGELDRFYSHKKALKGHKDMLAPGYTTCPQRLAEALPLLRVTPPAPVPPPQPLPKWSADDIRWLTWILEQLSGVVRASPEDMGRYPALLAALLNETPKPGAYRLLLDTILPALAAEKAKL